MNRLDKKYFLGLVIMILCALVACKSGSDETASGDTPGDTPGDTSPSSLVVGLVVKNDLDQARVDEPVSYGVPFSASDNITSTDSLRLYP